MAYFDRLPAPPGEWSRSFSEAVVWIGERLRARRLAKASEERSSSVPLWYPARTASSSSAAAPVDEKRKMIAVEAMPGVEMNYRECLWCVRRIQSDVSVCSIRSSCCSKLERTEEKRDETTLFPF